MPETIWKMIEMPVRSDIKRRTNGSTMGRVNVEVTRPTGDASSRHVIEMEFSAQANATSSTIIVIDRDAALALIGQLSAALMTLAK